jgi:hypothetical protein
MSNELVKKLEQSLTLGGLDELVRQSEVVMLLIDTSSSMSLSVSSEYSYVGKSRIDAMREVVADVKKEGHVPMIAFGGEYDAQVRFVDDVPNGAGGTPLHLAIPFAAQYGATRVVVISDGHPDLTEQTIEEVKRFGGRVDIVYVGPPNDPGEKFLQQLAVMSGGQQFWGDLKEIKQLAARVIGLLSGNVAADEPRVIITDADGHATVEAAPEVEEDDDDSDDDDDEDEDEDEDEEDDDDNE